MRSLLVFLFAMCCFGPSFAWAADVDPSGRDPSKGDVAAAEVLFQKGREAMDEGDYAAARESLQESLRLDPGAGTVMNLATCEEKLNMLASAWEHWQHALRLLDEEDRRREFVTKRIADLEGKLSYLTVTPQKGAPKSIRVERNGVELGRASWGVALPVDPGEVTVVVSSDKHETRSYELQLAQGESQQLVVSTGKVLPPPRATAAAPAGNPARTWGYVATGVGVVGLGLAGATAAMLPSTKNTVDEHCPALSCNDEGWTAVRRGKLLVGMNTAGFIAGGIGLVTGISLLVISAKKSGTDERASAKLPADLWISSDGAGVSYGRAF